MPILIYCGDKRPSNSLPVYKRRREPRRSAGDHAWIAGVFRGDAEDHTAVDAIVNILFGLAKARRL